MTFGQLIKRNRGNIFLEKSYIKCDGDATPRSKTERISDQEYYVLQFVFTVCQVEVFWNTLKLSCRPLAFTSSKAFLKNKKRSGTSLPASFFAWFLKKNKSCYILLPDQISWSGCLYLWDIWQYVHCNCLLTWLWINFEIHLTFLIKPLFLYGQKLKTFKRTKRALKMR